MFEVLKFDKFNDVKVAYLENITSMLVTDEELKFDKSKAIKDLHLANIFP
jgi:hypothetical protein